MQLAQIFVRLWKMYFFIYFVFHNSYRDQFYVIYFEFFIPFICNCVQILFLDLIALSRTFDIRYLLFASLRYWRNIIYFIIKFEWWTQMTGIVNERCYCTFIKKLCFFFFEILLILFLNIIVFEKLTLCRCYDFTKLTFIFHSS